MIRIAAILLLSIHFCSSICYSFLFECIIQISDKHTIQQLDKCDYRNEDLVAIAVPVNMPYVPSQEEYERWDGTIEFNGTYYNYVKRRMYNDTLHLLCLPNEKITELNAAKTDYSKQLSDAPTGKKENQPLAKKNNVLTEYNIHTTLYNFAFFTGISERLLFTGTSTLTDCFIAKPGKPPKTTA